MVLAEAESLNRRSEFFRYGSDFLRHKAFKSKAKLSCSRAAVYLAGGLSNQAVEFGQASARGQSALSTFFVMPSAQFGLQNPLTAFHNLLLQLSSPSRRVGIEGLTAEQFYFLPWDTLEQPWSASIQATTAIAVAIPLLVASTQGRILPALQTAPANRDALRPAAPIKAAIVSSKSAITTLKRQLKLQKPTGKIANIQSYIYPAQGELTSGYGWRWGRMHRGIDVAGPVGTPIVAAASGKVITAGWDDTGFGNRVEIQHPDGTVTLYGHNTRIVARVGMHVRQGQIIAQMGSTGHSTGSYVHFQMYQADQTVIDPTGFLSRQKLPQPPA